MRKAILFAIFSFCYLASTAFSAANNRLELEELSGPEMKLGHEALMSLSQKNDWELFLTLEKAVESGFYEIPLLVLDDLQESSKRVAARALRGVKDKEVIMALIKKIPELDPMSIGGGEGSRVKRKITLLEIETTISESLGLDLELHWDKRVPIETFRKALEDFPEDGTKTEEIQDLQPSATNRPSNKQVSVDPPKGQAANSDSKEDRQKWLWLGLMLIFGIVVGRLLPKK